jgi:filamentous hemagglutinin
MYLSQDPIGLAGNNPTLYGYVKDVNSWVDVFGLKCGKKSNLDWSTVSKKGETRIDHVNKHSVNDLQKRQHGVFYGDPVKVTNEAWNNRTGIKPISNGGTDAYHIPRANSGYSGGYGGQGQNLSHVTIVTKRGTNQIITSFPSFGN